MSTDEAERTAVATRTGRASMRKPRPHVVAGVVAVAAMLVAYPYLLPSSYTINVGIVALIFATAATGWNVLGGYTGQISLGHALFFGGAGYTVALLVRNGFSPWLGIAAGAVVAALLSVAIGFPSFRLRGHYYSIATIAFAEIINILVNNTSIIGSANGYTIPLNDPGLANLQFSLRDKTAYYLVALALFAVCTAVVWMFVRGRVGYYIRCIRDDDKAAAAIGIPVRRFKLYAAAVSGAVTGVAGGFFAMYVLFVDPPSVLGLSISIAIALTAVLGGAGRIGGPLVGAWVLISLQEYTRTHFSSSGRSTDLLLYGLLIVIVTIVEPRGLLGIADRFRSLVLRRVGRQRAHPATATKAGQA